MALFNFFENNIKKRSISQDNRRANELIRKQIEEIECSGGIYFPFEGKKLLGIQEQINEAEDRANQFGGSFYLDEDLQLRLNTLKTQYEQVITNNNRAREQELERKKQVVRARIENLREEKAQKEADEKYKKEQSVREEQLYQKYLNYQNSISESHRGIDTEEAAQIAYYHQVFSDTSLPLSQSEENVLSNSTTKPEDQETHEIIDIDGMDGHAFEYFCADLLARNGFENVSVTPGSGDQGIDIIAYRDDVKYGFQCKCYSSAIGNKAIQEVFAGKTYYQCHVGVVLTNNYFTNAAIDLAKHNGIVLWNRDKLLQMLKHS